MGNAMPNAPVVEMQYQGVTRNYIKVQNPNIPPNADCLAIIVVLHGGGGNAMQTRNVTKGGFEKLAPVMTRFGLMAPAVVLYPNGTEKHWNCGRYKQCLQSDDVGFLKAIVAYEKTLLPNAKSIRVLVTGISNGGFMCYRLAAEASDTFDCIAPVVALQPPFQVQWPKPVPTIIIVGTADTLVPFRGGPIGRLRLPEEGAPMRRWQERQAQKAEKERGSCMSADDTINFVIAQNKLFPSPSNNINLPITVQDDTSVQMIDYYHPYDQMSYSAPLRVFIVHNGGHCWPGGVQYLPKLVVGISSENLNSCEAIWSFFINL